MTDDSVKSFGRYLRAIRLDKGISIEQISEGTRIGVETLSWIEDEDHERLPAEVFVKGFIRAYAKVVEADAMVAIQGYERSLAAHRNAARHEAELIRSHHVFWPRLAMGVLMLGVIAAVSIYFLSGGQDGAIRQMPETAPPMRETPATAPPIVEEQTAPAVPASPPPTTPEPAMESVPAPDATPLPIQSPPAPPASAAPPVPAAETRQQLSIDAVEETWLKVIIDGMRSSEFMLKPGDHLQLEADKNFNLLIGNAAGITMRVNGKEVAVTGRSGQVITLQLP